MSSIFWYTKYFIIIFSHILISKRKKRKKNKGLAFMWKLLEDARNTYKSRRIDFSRIFSSSFHWYLSSAFLHYFIWYLTWVEIMVTKAILTSLLIYRRGIAPPSAGKRLKLRHNLDKINNSVQSSYHPLGSFYHVPQDTFRSQFSSKALLLFFMPTFIA